MSVDRSMDARRQLPRIGRVMKGGSRMYLSWENGLRWGEVKWYYDFMAEHGPGVPEAIARRVRRCLVFRRQIDRLQRAVPEADGETNTSRSRMKRDVIDTLSGHFRCLNEQVTCSRVKPFLPGLLVPAAQVRIPTPITVHLDHCPECAEDLEALRELGLEPEQLERLERLYQGTAAQDRRLCRKARSRIAAFARGRLDGIERELLDHLCTCARCRSRVYRSRQGLLESEAKSENQLVDAEEEVPTAQLFDYAVPYGRTNVEEKRVDESPAHAVAARLRKIQELDETIYGIAERTDSGIATIYRTVETDAQPRRDMPPVAEATAVPGTASSYSDLYPGYPIHVQVIRGRPQPATTWGWSPVRIKAAWTRRACSPRVRLILKAAVAVAAVIPLVLLFQTTNTASGITLGQVFKALEDAPNIHVSRFGLPAGQLTQEWWISRRMNRVLMVTGQQQVLHDLQTRKEHVYRTAETRADVRQLSERQYTNARRLIDACLGFGLSDIPSNRKWSRIRHGAVGDLEAYELTYSARNRSAPTRLMRWEITVDPVTRLPGRAQAFWRTSAEAEWQYLSTTELQYLADDEMAPFIGLP